MLEEAVFERTQALATEKLRAEHEKAVVDQQKQEIERLLDQAKKSAVIRASSWPT